jgi:hypothetical protein
LAVPPLHAARKMHMKVARVALIRVRSVVVLPVCTSVRVLKLLWITCNRSMRSVSSGVRTLRLACPIGVVLAVPVVLAVSIVNCGRGGAAGPTGVDATPGDATPEAQADSILSDASPSTSSAGPASDGELDAASEGGDTNASTADGPTEVGPDALCGGPPCPTPVFCPAGGNLGLATMGVTITTPGFPNAIIYYTTDGTLPTHASAVYAAPISVTGVEAIHAIAFELCVCTDSFLGTASFSALPPIDGEVADCAAHD